MYDMFPRFFPHVLFSYVLFIYPLLFVFLPPSFVFCFFYPPFFSPGERNKTKATTTLYTGRTSPRPFAGSCFLFTFPTLYNIFPRFVYFPTFYFPTFPHFIFPLFCCFFSPFFLFLPWGKTKQNKTQNRYDVIRTLDEHPPDPSLDLDHEAQGRGGTRLRQQGRELAQDDEGRPLRRVRGDDAKSVRGGHRH